jgi:hypothetical protein
MSSDQLVRLSDWINTSERALVRMAWRQGEVDADVIAGSALQAGIHLGLSLAAVDAQAAATLRVELEAEIDTLTAIGPDDYIGPEAVRHARKILYGS